LRSVGHVCVCTHTLGTHSPNTGQCLLSTCDCEKFVALAPRPVLTNADIDQIVEGIEEFIISGDEEVDAIWQPYIAKLNALKT
jgi:hypothetical protein